MLSKRFKYDGKPIIELNELQLRIKNQIEKKIAKNLYSFEKVPCCICEGKNFELLSEKDIYGLYLPVVICKDCGLIQTNPRMTHDSYNQFYNDEYRKLHEGKSIPRDDFFILQYERGREIYEYLEKNLEFDLANLKVLEVGTGSGGILHYFRQKRNEVCGCDLVPEYIEFGRKKYDLNLHVGTINDIDVNWNPDVVIYSHVLEHILNPVDELTNLRPIMHENTILYIQVPGLRYMKYYCGGNFLKWIRIAHVYYFTLRTLKNLLYKAGYNFIYGNEIIHCIFNLSSSKKTYESDYNHAVSFLRKMEFYRFMPSSYNIKRLPMSTIIWILKRFGLYNLAKKAYRAIKKIILIQ